MSPHPAPRISCMSAEEPKRRRKCSLYKELDCNLEPKTHNEYYGNKCQLQYFILTLPYIKILHFQMMDQSGPTRRVIFFKFFPLSFTQIDIYDIL